MTMRENTRQPLLESPCSNDLLPTPIAFRCQDYIPTIAQRYPWRADKSVDRQNKSCEANKKVKKQFVLKVEKCLRKIPFDEAKILQILSKLNKKTYASKLTTTLQQQFPVDEESKTQGLKILKLNKLKAHPSKQKT